MACHDINGNVGRTLCGRNGRVVNMGRWYLHFHVQHCPLVIIAVETPGGSTLAADVKVNTQHSVHSVPGVVHFARQKDDLIVHNWELAQNHDALLVAVGQLLTVSTTKNTVTKN
jgi:hypothetical protein